MDYFLRNLNSILIDADHFCSIVKRLSFDKNKNDAKTNTYRSFDGWIYILTKLNQAGKLDGQTYVDELAYFKFNAAYLWIKGNPSFATGDYPGTTYILGEPIGLWHSISMFNYTKQNFVVVCSKHF